IPVGRGPGRAVSILRSAPASGWSRRVAVQALRRSWNGPPSRGPAWIAPDGPNSPRSLVMAVHVVVVGGGGTGVAGAPPRQGRGRRGPRVGRGVPVGGRRRAGTVRRPGLGRGGVRPPPRRPRAVPLCPRPPRRPAGPPAPRPPGRGERAGPGGARAVRPRPPP